MINSISVLGLGKLGCSMAAVFANSGFDVIGYDADPQKNLALNSGRAPIYEKGLGDLITRNRGRLRAGVDAADAVLASDVTFVVVPTPSTESGQLVTRIAAQAVRSAGTALRRKRGYHTVVLTSTVLPGNSRQEILPALEESSGRICGDGIGFCYSPEFIALGSVLRNLVEPDYFLIGQFDARSGDVLEYVNRRVAGREITICRMTIEEAELAKIATNAYVTMKISFANYLADICGRLPNSDVDHVTRAVGLDSRIGAKYLSGGLGFGGPCFPRDNVALARYSEGLGVDSSIPLAVERFNRWYSESVAGVVARETKKVDRVGVVGLTYKPGSHILEESPSLAIIEALQRAGRKVRAYDPLQDRFEEDTLPEFVDLAGSLSELVELSEAVVLCHQDLALAQEVLSLIRSSGRAIAIVDCWRLLDGAACAGLPLMRIGAMSFS